MNNNNDQQPHIVIVDDDELVLYSMKAILDQSFSEVVALKSANEALHHIKNNPTHIVITDVVMNEMSGWRFISEARECSSIPFVPLVISGYDDEVDLQEKVDTYGALAYLTKPFGAKEISRMVRNTLENHLNFCLTH